MRPTAIFAASDEMAIGALLAARELGYRVPEDLSVVGIDGHELGEFFRLTTVDQFPPAGRAGGRDPRESSRGMPQRTPGERCRTS